MQQLLEYSWTELEYGSKSTVHCKHGVNSVTQGSRPGPKVTSLHLTFNIGLPRVCLLNRFVPYWCILLFVQSMLCTSAQKWRFIWIRVVTSDVLSLNPSVLHIHQSFSFSCSQFTSKMTFQTREQKKRSLVSAAQGPDFPLLSTMPGKVIWLHCGSRGAQSSPSVLCSLCEPAKMTAGGKVEGQVYAHNL